MLIPALGFLAGCTGANAMPALPDALTLSTLLVACLFLIPACKRVLSAGTVNAALAALAGFLWALAPAYLETRRDEASALPAEVAIEGIVIGVPESLSGRTRFCRSVTSV